MTHEAIIPEAATARYFFKGQALHFGSLLFLLPVSWAFAAPALGDDQWLGFADTVWFWACALTAIVHQLIVWWGFRAQLGWAVLSRAFGSMDMVVWGILFTPLLVARPLLVIGLAVADTGSADLPGWLSIPTGALLLLPAMYAMYSVVRYFGFRRAYGGDHFRQKYREMPLVRQGAFKYTSNAMYGLVFLGFWGIALVAGSLAALSAAFFQHAFIWAHYYGTEAPDMKLIYG